MVNKSVDSLLAAMHKSGHYTDGSIYEIRSYIEELEKKSADWIAEKRRNKKSVENILKNMENIEETVDMLDF